MLDIDKLVHLRWIHLIRTGIDRLPLDKVLKKELILTNSRGVYSIPIAEWVIGKILEIYKNSKKYNNLQNKKLWHKHRNSYELFGKVIRIMGAGSIGVEVAKRLKAFDAVVYGINTTGKSAAYFHESFPVENAKEVLSKCDIVVLALPSTSETNHFVNKDVLSILKEDAVIVNVSRGNIIDEVDLVAHLKGGHFLGVALDVFEKEPLSENSPLWGMVNVYITPHISYLPERRLDRVFNIIYENLKRYKSGKKLINVININRGY